MPEVSFQAAHTNSSPPADAWTWQAWISWYLRLAIALTLLVAGGIASVFTLSWNIEWAGFGGGIVLTAFLIGLMPMRHYFQASHPGLAKWTLIVWIVVAGMSFFAAVVSLSATSPRDTLASLDHELELCNARAYPPRYVIAEKRARAVQFCPDYEKFFSKIFFTPACTDARRFEEDLARYDRCDFADRKLMYVKRNPDRPAAPWWRDMDYVSREARLLPIRALLVLVTGMAFWGFVEACNTMLAEPRIKGPSPIEEPAPAYPGVIPTLTGLNEGFEIWKQSCVGRQAGNVLTASEVYSHYAQWTARVLRLPMEEVLSASAFHASMRASFTTNGKQYSNIIIHDAQGIWNDIEKMKEA